MSEINYTIASSKSTIPDPLTVIREVEINNNFIGVYYAKDEWHVQLGYPPNHTFIKWTEFLDIVCDLSKFVAQETQALIAESANSDEESA